MRKEKFLDVANGSLCRINNSHDIIAKPFPPDEIIRRAESRVGKLNFVIQVIVRKIQINSSDQNKILAG